MKEKELKTFTRSQLALYNGHDREEVWCGFEGKIYELTHSRMWASGRHYEHWAGQDLTDELKDAPHTERVFQKFKIVGIIEEPKP